MITRRGFVGIVAVGYLARPRRARAQAPAKTPRVAYVGSRSGLETNGQAFIEGLRAAGYVSGQGVVLDVRTYEWSKPESLSEIAGQLVTAGARTA